MTCGVVNTTLMTINHKIITHECYTWFLEIWYWYILVSHIHNHTGTSLIKEVVVSLRSFDLFVEARGEDGRCHMGHVPEAEDPRWMSCAKQIPASHISSEDIGRLMKWNISWIDESLMYWIDSAINIRYIYVNIYSIIFYIHLWIICIARSNALCSYKTWLRGSFHHSSPLILCLAQANLVQQRGHMALEGCL